MNAIQKTYSLVFLSIALLFLVFSLPFENEQKEITFDFFWSKHSSLHLTGLTVILVVLGIMYWALIKSASDTHRGDQLNYKSKLKKEIKKARMLLFVVLTVSAFLASNNLINNSKKKRLENDISQERKKIEDYEAKKQTREDFWNEMNYIFDQSEFQGRINKLWEFYLRAKENEDWLIYYLSKIGAYQKSRFNIEDPANFKAFIEKYAYTEEDVLFVENRRQIEQYISEKHHTIRQLRIFHTQDFRHILGITIIIMISLLYVLSPVVDVIRSIKEEAELP